MERNFFGISDEDFLDPRKVKLINGIAGSAKSTNVDATLKRYEIEYGRFTSTNKLKRDAQARFGGHCDTIAGGLFYTKSGRFFAEEKPATFSTVVIDEILQSDIRVFEWISRNIGDVNIIVCTDTHQMLSPVCGDSMLNAFDALSSQKNAIRVDLLKTYRARTAKTEAYYYKAFEAVEKEYDLYHEDAKHFDTIKFSEMPYTHDDVYICHTNECERFLFDVHGVASDYAARLIPKGTIARKVPKDYTSYPIVPQSSASGKMLAYLQPEHIGTPTRYQGSEVTDNQTLYYLVEKNSRITPREWYTVVSRLYDVDNLCIVLTDPPKQYGLLSYDGKPVKETKFLSISDDVTLKDGTKLSEKLNGSKTVNIKAEDFRKLADSVEDTEEVHYNRDIFFFRGRKVMPGNEDESETKTNVTTMSSLLNKEPDFSYSFLNSFYGEYERAQKTEWGRMLSPMLSPLSLKLQEPGRTRESYAYGLDIRAAYPTILARESLPIDGLFYKKEREERKDTEFDWYVGIIEGQPGACLASGEFVDLIKKDGWMSFMYIGTCHAKRGSRMGNWLYSAANKCKESNEQRKRIHYGLMERGYLEPIDYKDGEPTAYARNDRNNHQLLMLAIRTHLWCIMAKVRREIYGSYTAPKGEVNIDAIYFDYAGDMEELAGRIKKAIPGYDFRIFKTGKADKNGEIIYKTYEELKSKKEIRREKERNRVAEKRKNARN